MLPKCNTGLNTRIQTTSRAVKLRGNLKVRRTVFPDPVQLDQPPHSPKPAHAESPIRQNVEPGFALSSKWKTIGSSICGGEFSLACVVSYGQSFDALFRFVSYPFCGLLQARLSGREFERLLWCSKGLPESAHIVSNGKPEIFDFCRTTR